MILLIRRLLTSGLLGLVVAVVTEGSAKALMSANHSETVISDG